MNELDQFDFAAELEKLQAKVKARWSAPEWQAYLDSAKARAEEEQRIAEEAERDAPYKRLSDCGVPRRVVDTVRSYSQTTAVDRVARWAGDRKQDERRWCLVLSADKGCGKSVAAGLWMLQTGAQTIRYTDKAGAVVRLPSWWQVSKFARMEAYDGKFDALCGHAGPVVVDDIGSEYMDGKGWFLQAFDAFIDARYSEYRPTMITTNLSAKDFKSRYSGRVVDRIRQGGSYYEFKGISMRGVEEQTTKRKA